MKITGQPLRRSPRRKEGDLPPPHVGGYKFGPRGFTILEVMIAIFIFALVLTAIYSTWFGILKGTKSGTNAAAAVQRSRIAMRALEDAFLTMTMFNDNLKHYWFITEANGDFSGASFVARLPASFPGVGRYGDQIVRRVTFSTRPGAEGNYELVMSQAPMLMNTNTGVVEPYSLVLAKDVTLFMLEFYDVQKNEWYTDWVNTNTLPRLIRITLGQGKQKGSTYAPQDIVTRVVAAPAQPVIGVQTGPVMNQGQNLGTNMNQFNPNFNNPNFNNPNFNRNNPNLNRGNPNMNRPQ
jgi:prepilin-type N-terminal cleavage/methylation domain-containing protein